VHTFKSVTQVDDGLCHAEATEGNEKFGVRVGIADKKWGSNAACGPHTPKRWGSSDPLDPVAPWPLMPRMPTNRRKWTFQRQEAALQLPMTMSH